ncbi:hypothetical protein ACLK11_14880 [Escherichia coli]
MKPNRAGYLMMCNLLVGGFNGPVIPVTPAKSGVGCVGLAGSPACPLHPTLRFDVPTPAGMLALLEELGEKVCKPALFFLPASGTVSPGCALRHNMRLLGPNSLG